jgi:hypothetical protein
VRSGILSGQAPSRTSSLSPPISHGEGYLSDASEDVRTSALDLSDSGFTAIPVPLLGDSLHGVTELDLSMNPMDGEYGDYLSEPMVLVNLESLKLRSCGLTSIEPLVKHLIAPNLKELDISDHQLEGSVPDLQKFFPRLERVIASNGSFDVLPQDTGVGLRVLDLSDNLVSDQDGSLAEQYHELGTKLII